MPALGVESRLEEVEVVHAGDLDRVLEGEKDALAGAFLGRQRQQVAPVEAHLTRSHLIALAAREHVRERALAGAVRSHDGVDLTRGEVEVDPLEDLLAVHAGPQIANRQHAIHPTLPSRLRPSNFCASTANSMGNSFSTSRQKPFTIIDTASSVDRPRWRQ